MRLGAVERHVGALQQHVAAAAMLGRKRDADAGADIDPVPVDLEGLVQRRDDRLRQRHRRFAAVLQLLDDDELVAAEPRQCPCSAAMPMIRLATSTSSRSPIGCPSVSLTDLEMVEVDEVQRDACPLPATSPATS